LDVKGLVSSLMAMEQRPIDLLTKQEVGLQAKLSNLGAIKSSIASLQSAAQGLATASATSYSANSSDSSRLTATATAEASLGTHSIGVTRLAQAQKLVAAGRADITSPIGLGTVTFTLGTIDGVLGQSGRYPPAPATTFVDNPDKVSVSIVIDSSNNSLAGIRDAINASAAGVKASIINSGDKSAPYRLVLTPSDIGAANSMKISVSETGDLQDMLAYDARGTQNLEQVQAAQDAELTVDGVTIVRDSNTVSDILEGVTLSLNKIDQIGDAPVSLTLQRDTSALKSALSAVVKAYNDTNATISGASAKGAVLQGDWTVLRLQSQIRSIFGESQQSAGIYTALSQLGAGFQKDGTLTLNTLRLSAALSDNPDAVGALTAAISKSLDTATELMLGATGPVSSKTDNINSSIADMDLRRAQMQKRLESVQARYMAQFTNLDTLLSSMQSTSSYLTQQLANLPTIGNNNN
jgi:flagellar hook-associated protein 2